MLQREIDKLRNEYQDLWQASAIVKWNTKSFISSFKEETFNVKELVFQHLKLQQKDATLSKIGKKIVSQWIDNNSVGPVRDMATETDLEKTTNRQCPMTYWKAY